MYPYSFDVFCALICRELEKTIDKNVYLYGSNSGSGFIKWLYNRFLNKTITAVIDRFAVSNEETILHIMSLYYIEEDICIINTIPQELGPMPSFAEVGEISSRLKMDKAQIINLWDILYSSAENISRKQGEYPAISYCDWLEVFFRLDISASISRKFIDIQGAHGYHAIDIRMLYDIFNDINFEKDPADYAIMDIGCGKGLAMLFFWQYGFKTVSGIEGNKGICEILAQNMNKLNIPIYSSNRDLSEKIIDNKILTNSIRKINYYLSKAQLLENELDEYDYFFMFNPFSYDDTIKTIDNIIKSLLRRPRKIIIIYAEPICTKYLLETGYFNLHSKYTKSIGISTYRAFVFESIL